MTISNPITTASNTFAARRDRPATSRGRSSKAAIPSRGRARAIIPIRPSNSPLVPRCLQRPRASWVTNLFRNRRGTCPGPIRIRSAFVSDPAPFAASANGSAAAITPRPHRRLRSCQRCCANRISRRVTTVRSPVSISTPPANARPASHSWIPMAMNGSSLPIL